MITSHVHFSVRKLSWRLTESIILIFVLGETSYQKLQKKQ